MLNIIKALKAGYRPYRAWWSGVELICRLLLVGIAVGLPGRTVCTNLYHPFIVLLINQGCSNLYDITTVCYTNLYSAIQISYPELH